MDERYLQQFFSFPKLINVLISFIFIVRIFQDKIPTCQEKKCGGIVKPDIVFFGENLPEKFYNHIKTDFSKCDLLIVMGSSLVVQPFASLVER